MDIDHDTGMDMLKESWTVSEVNALPAGEHDYFERKSGQLVDSDDFRDQMAKAISAFANSGGGHVVLGVAVVQPSFCKSDLGSRSGYGVALGR